MNMIHLTCPECSGNVLFSMNSFPYSSARDGDIYQVRCPICGSEFPIGYIAEFKKAEPIGKTSGSIEVQNTSAGYGFVGKLKPGPSPNDQRSDTLNSNNPARSAAANNRSNQMNPNNPAYRSSRR